MESHAMRDGKQYAFIPSVIRGHIYKYSGNKNTLLVNSDMKHMNNVVDEISVSCMKAENCFTWSHAVARDCPRACELLMKECVSADVSALHEAASENKLKVLRILINDQVIRDADYAINPDEEDELDDPEWNLDGTSDTDYNCLKKKKDAVYAASKSGRLDALKLILSSMSPSRVSLRNGLIVASEFGHLDILKTLLEANAPLTYHALWKAAWHAQGEALKFLLKQPGAPDIGVEAAHGVAESGNSSIMKILVDAGVPELTQVMTTAAVHGNISVIQTLLDGGVPASGNTMAAPLGGLIEDDSVIYAIIRLLFEAGAPFEDALKEAIRIQWVEVQALIVSLVIRRDT
jgi:hypothetical protein